MGNLNVYIRMYNYGQQCVIILLITLLLAYRQAFKVGHYSYHLQCFIQRNIEEGIPIPSTIRIKLTDDMALELSAED